MAELTPVVSNNACPRERSCWSERFPLVLTIVTEVAAGPYVRRSLDAMPAGTLLV